MDGLASSRVTDVDKIHRLRNAVLKCASIGEIAAERGLDAFPFTTPSTLSRRDLKLLSKQKYWVAEKSDGERVLLLSLGPKAGPDEGVYIVTRTYDFLPLARTQLWLPSKTIPGTGQHETLLDAMVVFNHHYKSSVVMVLDIYSLESMVAVSLANLNSRLQAIREGVIAPVRAEKSPMSVPILGKEYWPLEKISTVLSSVKEYSDEQGPRFIYRSVAGNRFNENDGVVFVPDAEPLLTGSSNSIKKWKWPRLTAVRFLIRPRGDDERRRYDAYYQGPSGEPTLYRELFFDDADVEKLNRALADYDLTEGVFECHYDSEMGEWQYNRPRFDLDPHAANTVMGLLEDTANSISAATLFTAFDEKYRVLSQPGTPGTPQAEAAPSAKAAQHRANTQSQRVSPRALGSSPSHQGLPRSAQQAPAERKRREDETVLATPSPPNEVGGGVKRARTDSELLVEAPLSKRARTE